MDSRIAFLKAASTLLHGFFQLCHYRIVGNSMQICILDVNVKDRELYKSIDLPIVEELKKVTPWDYRYFEGIFQESSIVLAFSWLETFLAEVEEALYMMSPANLGEQVQVKLGKILNTGSIEELLHDIVKRRVRERSQWSLANRFKELREHQGFSFTTSEKDIEWISTKRNEIIHDRRIGLFQVNRKRVTYEPVRGKPPIRHGDVNRFLNITANSVADLYDGACRALKITSRFSKHRQTKRLIASWRKIWSPEGSSPNTGVQPTPASERG